MAAPSNRFTPHESVKGHDFEQSFTSIDNFTDQYKSVGFQATNLQKSIEIIKEMIALRRNPIKQEDDLYEDVKTNCTIFLSYTSNMISSGLRDTIRFLVKNKMVDVLVTTAGGIEEDLIKCMAPTFLGDFRHSGVELYKNQLNRIGNLMIPSSNYCIFEKWITPIFAEMHAIQTKSNISWTPSKIIEFLGQKIDNENSIYYWAHKNGIPVFSPAITDGSIGDMLYFYSLNTPGLKLDIVEDLKLINNIARHSHNSGMIILGGGLIKHHTCNANLMRNGADYAVYINTAIEYDGSDSGADPDEAVSWGKIKGSAQSVKVFSDATIVFPLIVASTFANQEAKSYVQ